MKGDSQVQRDVVDALQWEPSLEAASIGVTARGGVVTLTGDVATYGQRYMAESAAGRVRGVGAVANELEVRPGGSGPATDADLARAAVHALRWRTAVPDEAISVTVADGWVTLDGEVEQQYQKEAAAEAVRPLRGVCGVIDRVRVRPRVSASELRSRIEAAFQRSAAVEGARVQVEADGDSVILRGAVRSPSERHEAERTAWAAPGVAHVSNQIVVSPLDLE